MKDKIIVLMPDGTLCQLIIRNFKFGVEGLSPKGQDFYLKYNKSKFATARTAIEFFGRSWSDNILIDTANCIQILGGEGFNLSKVELTEPTDKQGTQFLHTLYFGKDPHYQLSTSL